MEDVLAGGAHNPRRLAGVAAALVEHLHKQSRLHFQGTGSSAPCACRCAAVPPRADDSSMALMQLREAERHHVDAELLGCAAGHVVQRSDTRLMQIALQPQLHDTIGDDGLWKTAQVR